MTKDFLQPIYDLHDQAATDAYYSEWAATYDEELARNGYRSPQRCAQALVRFSAVHTAVLDVGCGTGMSGMALAKAGYTDISGQDVNAEMLERATALDLYRELWVGDPADPFPFEAGRFAAIAAVGVIGIGAAPASLIGDALDALRPGGHFVFSMNDHALDTPEFAAAVTGAVSNGMADQVFCERGPHLEGLDSSSTVFVLRRR